ncbi:hypothetical protein C1645_829257 [Glomus cerebriforme]|uniref:Uncharacterized protein n=1 Tax=Glomus cerebriforme TaxID=658196 RepID=A0A397SJY5_9GLOM|nr:hypothetical protein C1645_829257 [Glomus cerebriforme]
MIQSELSEFLDVLSAQYKQDFKAEDVSECLYKIHDDSIRPRHFLGADNENEIEVILSDHEGHSLYEYIDGDEPVRPIIDFDLPIETLNAITPKLSYSKAKNLLCHAFRDVCLEVSPKWDKKTITIAESSDANKISFHVSTFGMRLPNIARVAIFTELVCKKLPIGLQDKEEHICVKKAICPKDGSIFDFMIRPSNDESEVIDNSPLLAVPETESVKYVSICNETTVAEFELVEILLKEAGIEGYSLSYPSDNFPDKFPLSCASPSHCPLCDREHTSDNAYIRRNKKSYSFFCYHANQDKQLGERNPSLKLTISEMVLDRERKLPAPVKLEQPKITNPNNRFVFWDLLRMCTSGKKFSRAEVYEAIQATVACVQ